MRKLRHTYTRYLPPWESSVCLWKLRADKMAPRDANEIKEKMQAADLAFSWLGGIPSFLWDHEPGTLTRSNARKCLANTKLRKVSSILQSSADLSCFQYTFCSGKVATLYSGCVEPMWTKSAAFSRLQQYVIRQALALDIMVYRWLTLLVANVVMIEVRLVGKDMNYAVFDFVLLPHTLEQANVTHYSHRPVLEATIKVQQALKAWRDEFCQGHNNNDDALLVFFLPPDSYVDFYHSSRKVSQKVVKVKLTYDMEDVSPYPNLPEIWEEAFGCIECTEDTFERSEKLLVEERFAYWLVSDGDKQDELEKISDPAKPISATFRHSARSTTRCW
ncbi:hypothetical protein SELMODRAFT_418200 [Selaginella moellendorffii]|uniref:Uncharacterized protein n=1 Tax=Selaginella moellendorffii TaxID=88036 RepID=D8S4Z9_SELML|nr:hypothetical protein SELMODRAFT_418200 [Selaginella moellendorffii]